MTDFELLEEVKKRKGITGEYQDNMLLGHIEDVKQYMIDAGVPDDVMSSNRIIGAVTRGVSDLWNYGAGDGELSTFFYQRVTQLVYKGGEENE